MDAPSTDGVTGQEAGPGVRMTGLTKGRGKKWPLAGYTKAPEHKVRRAGFI
jgi:hypothetical protein